jgi:hypothetical protein
MFLHGSGGCVSSKLGVHVYLIDRHELGGRGFSFLLLVLEFKGGIRRVDRDGRCEVGFRIGDDDADDEGGLNW